MWLPRSQSPSIPVHWALAVHSTHWSTASLQTGLPGSVQPFKSGVWHATHCPVAPRQTGKVGSGHAGAAPPESLAQPTQAFETQTGVVAPVH